jgi:general secretion pathway protein F
VEFEVRYFDPGNQGVSSARIVAATEAEARHVFQGKGWTILAIQTARSRKRSTTFDVPGWCRELRALLLAGMTVVEAIETMHAQASQGNRIEQHEQLLAALRQGQSLSSSMQAQSAFPAVLIASVKAGERTSALVEALDDYLRYDDLIQGLRRKVVSAAIYPALVAGLGAAVALFLLIYVVPRFAKMYADYEGSVSAATRALLWLSELLSGQAPLTAVIAGVALAAAVLAYRAGAVMRLAEWMLDGIPVLRAQWDHFRLAKMYQALMLMFKGGYALDEALAVCGTLQLGERHTRAASEVRRLLSEGRSVSASFRSAGLTDAVTERLLAVGERSGNFERILDAVAARHAQAFTLFVERATRVVEPILLLLVALIVGGIVVLLYMPVFDIAGSIQ